MMGPGPNGAAAPTRRWRAGQHDRYVRSAASAPGCRTPGAPASACTASSIRRCCAAPRCCIRRWPSAARWRARRGERVLTYGLGGSETHWALEDVIAEVEGGTRCAIVCSGLAAVTTPLLAFLKTGDHCLMPDSVYGPARNFCDGVLQRFGVETTFYDPEIDEAGIAALMRPNTTVVYTESPGSHTFEVQDVPAIARAAHARGAKVLMDNTWGIHHFQPFRHGVDVSIQAATKYPAGHSDMLIGSVTVNSDADWQTLHATVRGLGQYASPDDCWLTLRGMRTMGVRLAQQMDSGIAGRALAAPAAGGEAGAASGAARCARVTRSGSATFPVRAACSASSSSPEYSRREHACVRRGAGAVRHRRVVGRLRKPGVADDGLRDPHGGQRQGSTVRWCACISGWRMWTI